MIFYALSAKSLLPPDGNVYLEVVKLLIKLQVKNETVTLTQGNFRGIRFKCIQLSELQGNVHFSKIFCIIIVFYVERTAIVSLVVVFFNIHRQQLMQTWYLMRCVLFLVDIKGVMIIHWFNCFVPSRRRCRPCYCCLLSRP